MRTPTPKTCITALLVLCFFTSRAIYGESMQEDEVMAVYGVSPQDDPCKTMYWRFNGTEVFMGSDLTTVYFRYQNLLSLRD